MKGVRDMPNRPVVDEEGLPMFCVTKRVIYTQRVLTRAVSKQDALQRVFDGHGDIGKRVYWGLDNTETWKIEELIG